MLLYPTFIPNQNNYNMLGIKLGIKKKNFRFSYKVSSFPFTFCGIDFSVSPETKCQGLFSIPTIHCMRKATVDFTLQWLLSTYN